MKQIDLGVLKRSKVLNPDGIDVHGPFRWESSRLTSFGPGDGVKERRHTIPFTSRRLLETRGYFFTGFFFGRLAGVDLVRFRRSRLGAAISGPVLIASAISLSHMD